MIEFDKLQWNEEPPRARRLVSTAKMGMRICVYDPKRRGSPHARLFVTDPDIVAVLRGQHVRFLTAYSAEHQTRAMAFELHRGSGYQFVNAPKGTSISVAFGLFAWMDPAVAAHPIVQWAWDGQRLIVLMPDSLQQDVNYRPQITSVPNALALAAPVNEPVETPTAPPVVETVIEASDIEVIEPVRTITPPVESESAAPPRVEKPTPRRGRPPKQRPVEEERVALRDVNAPLFKPRELTAAERDAATVEIRRHKKHKPITVTRVITRPETPATALQAKCRFLQLDADVQDDASGTVLTTTGGRIRFAEDEARVFQLMLQNVERGYGATGLAELHTARFRPGDQQKSLTSLTDTESWLVTFATLLNKAGATLRVESRLYALDMA